MKNKSIITLIKIQRKQFGEMMSNCAFLQNKKNTSLDITKVSAHSRHFQSGK